MVIFPKSVYTAGSAALNPFETDLVYRKFGWLVPASLTLAFHLAALMMRRSPLLPGSMDPYLSDKPRAAAALIVAAARASGILMWRLTQARCITVGLSGGDGDVRGRKSERQRGWEWRR